MSTPTGHDERPPVGIPNNSIQSFTKRPQQSIFENYRPNFSPPFATPFVKHSLPGFQATVPSSEDQYTANNQAPMLAYNNPTSFAENYPPTGRHDDLVKTFTKITSSRFPSTRPSFIHASLTKALEEIEKDNEDSVRRSSQPEYQFSSSVDQFVYSSIGSEYLFPPEDSCSSSGYR